MSTDVSQAKKFQNDLGSDTPAATSFRVLLNDIATALPPGGGAVAPLATPIVVTGAASLYPATAPGTAWVPIASVTYTAANVGRPLAVFGSATATVQGAGGAGTPGGGNIRVVAFPNGASQPPVVVFQKGTGNQETIPAGIFQLAGSGLVALTAPGPILVQLQASNATAAGLTTFAPIQQVPNAQQNAPELIVVQP